VTKVKGCTGTYLWGPDELEKMRTAGNLAAHEVYGVEKIHPDASKERKQRYVIEKYDKRSYVNAAAPPAKATSSTVKTEKAKPVPTPRVERLEHAANNVIVPSSQHGAYMKQGAPPAARKADIPDSFFDELFNEAEDSYLINSSTTLKPPHVDIVQPTLVTCSQVDSSLDDFLNSTLHANVQVAPTAVSKCPATSDPWLKPQETSVADPFADWPVF